MKARLTLQLHLLLGGMLVVLAKTSSVVDLSHLDQNDQRLLSELNAPEIIQFLNEKAVSDNALSAKDVAVIAPLLQAAQAKGIPLASLIYPDWMGQDQMRRVLTIEFKRSFMNGGIGWKYVPALIDAFLAARDSPPSLYFNSSYSYEEQNELLYLEQTFRDTVIDNLYALAYPDKMARPQRSDAGPDGGNAPTLKRALDAILQSQTASLSPANRDLLKAQLVKVEAFIANPPPLPVARWRQAFAKEQAAKDQLAKPMASQTSPSNSSTGLTPAPPSRRQIEAKPTSTPSEETTSSTPWSIIVVLIVAAIGLLWLLLKRRS